MQERWAEEGGGGRRKKDFFYQNSNFCLSIIFPGLRFFSITCGFFMRNFICGKNRKQIRSNLIRKKISRYFSVDFLASFICGNNLQEIPQS